MHVFIGVVGELVKILFRICKKSEEQLKRFMNKIGVDYLFKPEYLSGRQALKLMKRSNELLDCVHEGNCLKFTFKFLLGFRR